MKKILYCLIILNISCNQEPKVNYDNENCFEQKSADNKFHEFKPIEKSIILKAKYPNLEITEIKNPTKFDQNYFGHTYSFKDVRNYDSPNDFECLRKFKYQNQDYFLAKNQFGYWLIELLNKKEKPYFIGIAYDKYIHIKNSDKFPLIENGKIILEAAFIRQTDTEVILLSPPKYETIKDNLLIKIDLEKVKKDSDNDGFNDIFEEYIGLNPNSKDSDNDGVNDFGDSNPKYKSEKSDFTQLYELLTSDLDYMDKFISNEEVNKHRKISNKNPFIFKVYYTDCNYFNSINPVNEKVIFISEKESDKPNFSVEEIHYSDQWSKIKKIGKNNFEISTYRHGADATFKIKNTNKGWKIEIISMSVV